VISVSLIPNSRSRLRVLLMWLCRASAFLCWFCRISSAVRTSSLAEGRWSSHQQGINAPRAVWTWHSVTSGFFLHFSPNPTAFRRKALSEQLLAMISASASDNRSSERLSLIDRRMVEASAKSNYRPLAASSSPSCSRRLSGSARSLVFLRIRGQSCSSWTLTVQTQVLVGT